MADFFQNADFTTLHALGQGSLERVEVEVARFTQTAPVALVLPCLYSELEGAALPRIVNHLAQVGYLHQLVITLGVAGPDEFRKARAFFGRLPQPVRVLWNDGPRVQEIKRRVRSKGFHLGEPGKGLAVWMAYGYLLGDESVASIALHDCDIVTYDRRLLDRLVLPLVHPAMEYTFCKGYYARVTDRLHGRVTRVFVTPLVRALGDLLGPVPLLRFLAGFRYPLAGEFAMTTAVARTIRTPADWGLEIGTLAEVFRTQGPRRVCQADLDLTYEHKHQDVGTGSGPPRGLVRMARELAGTLLRALANEGVALPDSLFRGLGMAYLRRGRNAVGQYADLSAVNGLRYDRHGEGALVETLGGALEGAIIDFRDRPLGVPAIPGWEEVAAALPEIHQELREAVEADGRVG